MRGRLFDSHLSRFTQADPFVMEPFNPQGFNRFAYVNNNPINWVDPSGFGQECANYGCNIGSNEGHGTPTPEVHITEPLVVNGTPPQGPSGQNHYYQSPYQNMTPAASAQQSVADANRGQTQANDRASQQIAQSSAQAQQSAAQHTGASTSTAQADSARMTQPATDTPRTHTLEEMGIVEDCTAGTCAQKFYGEGLKVLDKFKMVDTSETWKTGFFIAISMAPLPGGLFETFAPKLLSAFTQTTRDAVIASARLAKGMTTRGASLLEKRVAEGVITGIKPTQANAERIIADILENPLRTQPTGRFGQVDVVGKSFGQEINIRINTDTGNLIGFRVVDF